MRFTIRDVLWLTLVVGLVVGWWVDRAPLAQRCRDALVIEQSLEDLVAEWEFRHARLYNALLRSGLTINDEGRVVRIQPFDPALYPPLE